MMDEADALTQTSTCVASVEAVQAHCPCGAVLDRAVARQVRFEPVETGCGSCGRRVRAVFWRPQAERELVPFEALLP